MNRPTRTRRVAVVAALAVGLSGVVGVPAAIVTATPADAGVVDSGPTCGRTSFWTWWNGTLYLARYQGSTGRGPAAHRHRWNLHPWGRLVASHTDMVSAGYCGDVHR